MIKSASKLNPYYSELTPKLKSKISYRIELSIKLLALAMYKDENNFNSIKRFYSNSWQEEVFIVLDYNYTLKLRAFINTACLNLSEPFQLRMFIAIDDKPVAEKLVELLKVNQYSEWYDLIYSS